MKQKETFHNNKGSIHLEDTKKTEMYMHLIRESHPKYMKEKRQN